MIKVLIVDDSFVMRKLLSDMLGSCEGIEIAGAARSGNEALKKIPQVKPDVITLDLVMPGWDGLTTLKHIMEERPTPVVILSAHSKEGADITIKCLDAGAVSFVLKPSGELSLDIEEVRPKLLEEIRLAAAIDIGKLKVLSVAKAPVVKYKPAKTSKIVIIGASTGGLQTIEAVLSSLPADFFPPIIVVQHMPSIEFTQSWAEHLKRAVKSAVKVAEDNEVVRHNKIYLVPGGYSMTLQTIDYRPETRDQSTEVAMRLIKDKAGSLTPSINMTMKSAAGLYNHNTIGVVLTGMGSDGTEGMQAIKGAGGSTLVQDESALIFGMPKSVIDSGYADSVLPIDKIAEKLLEIISI